MTDIDEAKVISALREKSKFNFIFFFFQLNFLGFHVVVATLEDLSIDVSFT